jgi:hypothetical protein
VQGQESAPALRHVVRSAVVVCEECDRAGHAPDEQRRCSARAHFNALRMADGSYWMLSLDGADARRLASDATLRGRRIVVEGELYAPMRTLHLTRWSELHGGDL